MREFESFVLYVVATLAALAIAQSISSYHLANVWPSRGICLYRVEVNHVLSANDWPIRVLRIQILRTGLLTSVVAMNFPSLGRAMWRRVSK
jgi:hypothetical protein